MGKELKIFCKNLGEYVDFLYGGAGYPCEYVKD